MQANNQLFNSENWSTN